MAISIQIKDSLLALFLGRILLFIGIAKEKVLPSPKLLLNHTYPPCSWTICLTR